MSAVALPFDQIASVAREMALTERLRLANLEAQAVTLAQQGVLAYDASQGLAHLRWRLARIEAGADLLELLAPHEEAIRKLIVPRSPRVEPLISPKG
jgi:hypothetical protein